MVGNNHQCFHRHSYLVTHPVFVISHVAEDIIQVEDAAVTVFQPVNLQPVAHILKNREMGRHLKATQRQKKNEVKIKQTMVRHVLTDAKLWWQLNVLEFHSSKQTE